MSARAWYVCRYRIHHVRYESRTVGEKDGIITAAVFISIFCYYSVCRLPGGGQISFYNSSTKGEIVFRSLEESVQSKDAALTHPATKFLSQTV